MVSKLPILKRGVHLGEYLLANVRLHADVEAWEAHVALFLPVKCVIDECLARQKSPERLAHVNLTRHAVSLDKARYEHVLSKDIITRDFRADDAPNDFACVNAQFDVQIA